MLQLLVRLALDGRDVATGGELGETPRLVHRTVVIGALAAGRSDAQGIHKEPWSFCA